MNMEHLQTYTDDDVRKAHARYMQRIRALEALALERGYTLPRHAPAVAQTISPKGIASTSGVGAAQ